MDEKKIEQFELYITNYIKNFHNEDIISEKERVAIDLEKLYNYGIMEFIEHIYENPYDGIKILEKAYAEAYKSLKNEKNTNCVITIKNLPDVFKKHNNKIFTIKDIKSNTLGKLIEFEGIIVLATKIKSILKKAVYRCNNCENKIVINIDNPYEYSPESKSCNVENCNGTLQIVENESEYIDFQELKVQQPLDLMNDPEEPPKYISVFLENSPGIFCGRVKIMGI